MAELTIIPESSQNGAELGYAREGEDGFEVDAFVFDATVSESHGLETAWTEHPVEQGATLSDHFVERRLEVSISGIVTATPLVESRQEVDRLAVQLERLHELQREGTLFTLYLADGTVYEDMAITSSSWSRGGTLIEAEVSLSFAQIRRAELLTTDIPPELLAPVADELADGAGAEEDLGSQTGEEPGLEDAEQITSTIDEMESPTALKEAKDSAAALYSSFTGGG